MSNPTTPAAVNPLWTQVRTFMQRTCGVVLADEQSYLLDARLQPVARQHKFASIADYVSSACAAQCSSELARSLIDAMTTHETFFFRDASFWKALEEHVLPKLKANSSGPLKIWSAACSHGQEAYSLAMLLEEKWPALAATTTILATDVATLAVERARAGVYSTLEVNRGIGAARLLRHFDQEGGGYRIKPKLRDRIQWGTYNLLGASPAPTACDIVLCRNVLIYFNDADRKTVLSRLQGSAKAGGFIGLGATENISKPSVHAGIYLNEKGAGIHSS